MTFLIDGTDVGGYIKSSGVTRGSVYRVSKTRTTIEGLRYRSKIEKISLDLSFDPLEMGDLKKIAELISQDYVTIHYKDPILGSLSGTFIPTIGDTKLTLETSNEVTYWSGLQVNLEEQ